jgi:hypothetical protein
MATTVTTAKLTKLAQAGILKTMMPWLEKIYPYGKWFGIGALAAPTATYAINRVKGYNPVHALGMQAPENVMNTLTPRFARQFVNQPDNPVLAQALRKLQGAGAS